MIKVTAESGISFELIPTIFPDGTSQVWKLPEWVFEFRVLEITWNFEAEREAIDLLSLRQLLPNHVIDLHIPYLPYARQDKMVSNTSTFNLSVLANLINSLKCREVTAVDVHNPIYTANLINNFKNVHVGAIHELVVSENKIDFVVFPDKGALIRYGYSFPNRKIITCDKTRDQLTGAITGHKIEFASYEARDGVPHKFLIIDDLCDGGATFISVAQLLRRDLEGSVDSIDLYVTHGVFSKGKEHLLKNGINHVYTTNSLIKNGDGYKV